MIRCLPRTRLAALLVSIGATALPPSSHAMDCAKAKTPVELAICASGTLKADDAALARRYFALLKDARTSGFIRDGKSLSDLTLARQREWLARRDKTCGGLARDKIDACIAEAMRQRMNELDAQENGPGAGVPPDGVRLAAEKLTLAPSPNGAKTLRHNGRVVLEAREWDTQPFTIRQRWSSKDTEALLIEAGSPETSDCAHSYVVESRKPGEVVSQALGRICAGFDSAETRRDPRGFSLTVPATPFADGETTSWIASSGTLIKSRVAFAPAPGSTMAALMRSDKPELESPLSNAEFHAAVERLPMPDRTRIMTALWRVENTCNGCIGAPDQTLYGMRIDDDVVAYSGCGLVQSGTRFFCGQDDALAVWDRKAGTFHFAVALHRPDGRHADNAAATDPTRAYPPLAAWPPSAREAYELWRDGGKWTDDD